MKLSALIFVLTCFIFITPAYSGFDFSTEDIKNMSLEERINHVNLIASKNFPLLSPREQADQIFLLLQIEPYLENNPITKSILYKHVGAYLFKKRAYILSAEYQKLALQQSKIQNPNRHYKRILSNIGWSYHKGGILDSAIIYINLSIPKSHQENYSLLNNAAMFLDDLEKDTAWYYYKQAERQLLHQPQLFITSIRDNMANYKYKRQAYTEAIVIHQQNLDYLEQHQKFIDSKQPLKITYRKLKAVLGIALCKLKLNQYEEVESYIKLVKQYYKQLGNSVFQGRIEEDYFRLFIAYSDALNKPIQKSNYQDSLIQFHHQKLELKEKAEKDALSSLFTMKRVNIQNELELQRSITHKKEQKLQYQRLQLYIVLLIIGPIVVLILLLYRRKLQVKKQELKLQKMNHQLIKTEAEKAQLEKSRLAESLRQTEKDLQEVSTYLSDTSTWTDSIVSHLEILSKNKHIHGKELNNFLKDIKSRHQVNQRINLLYENIEKVNSSFYHTLNQKFPSLTEVEKEICGLIRLNMSNKDIAIFRNVTPQAIKMNRYRLRKKFNLTPDVNLYQFLKNLQFSLSDKTVA